jgi:hypothetical protein
MKWCMVRRAGSARVRGSGGVATCARCRARSCAARGKRWSVRAGTLMPLSASSGVLGTSRARARAGPTGGLDGRRGLVELDGGSWGLLAQWLVMASLQSFRPMGMCPGHAGERGRGQGEV